MDKSFLNQKIRKIKRLVKKIKFKILIRKLVKIFSFLLFLGIFLSIVGFLVVLSWLQEISESIPNIEDIRPANLFSSEIFDRLALEGDGSSGTRLYRFVENINSDPVKFEEIPDIVKLAFLAAEDKRFYEHPGFDVIGVLRSIRNIITRNPDPGGASTITQQTVRMLTRDKERTLERKVREILTAIQYEQKFSKDEILGIYLSNVPQGSNIIGVKTGARFYFGKDLSEINLAQAAILAAIVQNPAFLSPTRPIDDVSLAQDRLEKRMKYVFNQLEENLKEFNDIYRMYKKDESLEDFLTIEMINEARSFDWRSSLVPPVAANKKAGHFVNYVIGELQKRNYYKNERPFELSELQSGGFKIYTTLDYRLQEIAEKYAGVIGNHRKDLGVYNGSILTITPSNGDIITMAGSKNFNGEKEGCNSNGCKFDPQVNITTSLQQPGSTTKPFGYYEAFRQGKIFTGSFLPDVPMKLGNYEPKNWNGVATGVGHSANSMLRQSKNLPALYVLGMIGFDAFYNVVKDFGYTTYQKERVGWASILGSIDVTPLEHAQAYGVFANNGDLVKVDPILKIISSNGEVIYEKKTDRKRVADQQAVYLVNKVLENYDGTSFDGREMSGKTGTTDAENGNKDLWLVLYSPDFVTVGWAGNNNNDPLNPWQAWPGTVVQGPLTNYMREIGNTSYFSARSRFSVPAFVFQGGGSCNENGECTGVERGWMIRDRIPSYDHIKKTIKVCTDQPNRLARPIDISMGFAKEEIAVKWISPVKDDMFQKFIDDYVQKTFNARNGGPLDNEFCTIDRFSGNNGPMFYNIGANFVPPNKVQLFGSVFTNNDSITSLSFIFDNTNLIGCVVPSNSYDNFDLVCDLPSNIDNGIYTISFVAIDSSNIQKTENVSITIGDGVSSYLQFISLPTQLNWGVNVGNSISYVISLTSSSSSVNYSSVKLYQIRNNSSPTYVGDMTPVVGGFTFNWGSSIPNSNDNYSFFVEAKVRNNGLTKSNTSNVVNVIQFIPSPTPTILPSPSPTPSPLPPTPTPTP